MSGSANETELQRDRKAESQQKYEQRYTSRRNRKQNDALLEEQRPIFTLFDKLFDCKL